MIPLYKPSKREPHVFFEMESFLKTDAKFTFYSRVKEECKVEDKILGEARLPNAFTHWTYIASGKKIMITDVQGWRLGKGKYMLTDPIVFSSESDALGLIDWG